MAVTTARRMASIIGTVAGTSAGSGGPTGLNPDVIDNTVHWQYLGVANASAKQIKGAKYATNASAGAVAQVYFDAGVASN